MNRFCHLSLLLTLLFTGHTLIGQVSLAPNPIAPEGLSQFQFLAGNFSVLGRSKTKGGYLDYQGQWNGYYLLDGYIFTDEFSIKDKLGNVHFLGITYRSYDPIDDTWTMKFYDGIKREWIDTFHGKRKGGEMHLVAKNKDSEGRQFISRIKFYDMDENGFKWKSDRSYDNGRSWIEDFGIIKAIRVQ
ncbi:hypothetical protein GTQ34_14545 [Muricauda sp. JGD-17]|uniref:MORN repeat protein n=1 Tax=Flagellimonas ochracea TaxID=2696472 RepID=A0A964TDW7_9FLAO|nr:hypothetical protein [Allomuricauda ochracea]NAY93132.1 hypothetical protein [Allomuricauda ochracea]